MVEPTVSDVTSRVRMVPKPDGMLRMCVNYYRVNKILKDQLQPTPTMRQGIEVLKGSKFFSALDCKSGFWQIPLAEESRYLTAFVVGTTMYQWKVLPMGLKTAPGIFQAAMRKALSSNDDKAFVAKHGS